jgi:hypothetical protein
MTEAQATEQLALLRQIAGDIAAIRLLLDHFRMAGVLVIPTAKL